MAHLKITIDGTTAIDTDLGQWTTTPPPYINQLITTPKPQLWQQLLMIITAHTGGLTGQPANIHLTTRDDGWTLNYTEISK